MRILLIILFSIVLAISAPSQHRGLWVVRHTLLNDSESVQLVPTAKRLKTTDLYIQVRALGRTFFERDSAFTANDTGKAFRNFKTILKQAHNEHIRVHAWINTFFVNISIGNSTNNYLSNNEKSKYLLRRAEDELPVAHKELRKAGIEGDFIDPLDQGNISYIKSLSGYLIDSLHVDGIHLDYFRYPDFRFSFSPAGRTEFILKNYCDPIDIYLNNGKIKPSEKYSLNILYKKFLNQNIKNALLQIKNSIQRTKCKIVLSIAVKANPLSAENVYLQDWQGWLHEKLCNRVILMNYNNQDSVFYQNINQVSQTLNKNEIIVGIATYNLNRFKIVQRIEQMSHSAFAGYALFSYNDIRNKPRLMLRLENEKLEKSKKLSKFADSKCE